MWTLLATLIPTAIVILTVIFGIFRWAGKMDRNTVATEELTDAFRSFSDRISVKVENLEIRVSVLESQGKHRR